MPPYNIKPINRIASQRAAILLFLIGAFSITQIKIGFSIGVSEIFVYLAAPFLFLKNLDLLRRQGMMFLIFLGFIQSVICVVSGLYNDVPTYYIFKGLASTYPLFAFPVVLHHLLIKDFRNHKWLLLGICCSYVINIFVFQASYEITSLAQGTTGSEAVKEIMSGPIFWISRLAGFVKLPYTGWFLQCPIWYMLIGPVIFSIFCMLISASGRSAALASLGAILIVLFSHKSQSRIRKIGKNLLWLLLIGFIFVYGFKTVYSQLAKRGVLGAPAAEKYEKQTRGKKSSLALLMGGRSEFFIGVMAALEKPIMGHGPWAIDYGGYYRREFLSKYGNEEDYEDLIGTYDYVKRTGGEIISYIPAHSHIGSFWLWFGVIGLWYWLYVLYGIYRYFRREAHVIPQWFGFLGLGAPAMLWDIFFSGFGFRILTMPYVILLYMTHCIATNKIPLHQEELLEIARSERR